MSSHVASIGSGAPTGGKRRGRTGRAQPRDAEPVRARPGGIPRVARDEADAVGGQAGRPRPELVHRGMWFEPPGGVDRQGVIDGQAGPPQHRIEGCRGRVRQDPGQEPAVAQRFEHAGDLGMDR